jgi:CHC2 zinc finger
METSETTPKERHRGVTRRTVIRAAKELVPVVDLADRLCGPGKLRRVGGRWVARCPLPSHVDRSPSFTVYPETNSWYCYGCLQGGSVVDLYMHAHNYSQRDAHTAAGFVLLEFGHEVPQRPASWHRKQQRQVKVREAIDVEKMEHIRMLVFRLIWVPWLKGLPPWTRDEATASAWESSQNIARLLYEQRRSA